MICFDSAVDQHFAREPQLLFHAPLESASLNPNNRHILKDHLRCAAREIPLNSTFVIPLGRSSAGRVDSLPYYSRKEGEGVSLSPSEGRGDVGTTKDASIAESEASDNLLSAEGLLPDDLDPLEYAAALQRRQRTQEGSLKDYSHAAATETRENHVSLISDTLVFDDAQLWGEGYSETVEYLVQTGAIQQYRGAQPLTTGQGGQNQAHGQGHNYSHNQGESIDGQVPWHLQALLAPRSLSANFSKDVSLRMIDPVTITVVDDSKGGIAIDSLGYSRAFYELFEGATVWL